MSIHNSSGFSFGGKSTLNDVHGNQVNHHTNQTISGGVIHLHNQNTTQVTERTRYDEFDVVKTGHVIHLKDLYSKDVSGWHWQNGELVGNMRKTAQKTISTIQVHPDQQSKFTAITYEGEGAQEAWEKDFKQFSHVSRTGLFQLFGINRSEIPMLIFHHELIPVAHFYTKSFWMDVYLEHLRLNKRCDDEDLWMDTKRGIFCSGPAGPVITFPGFSADESVVQALPSTLDMLKEQSSITFFSQFGSTMDGRVLDSAWTSHARTYLDDLFPKTTEDHYQNNHHPQWTTDHPYLEDLWRNPPHHLPSNITDGLRFDTVYSPSLDPIARWPPEVPGLWKWQGVDGLVEETRVDGGLTRFELGDQGEEVDLRAGFDWEAFSEGWLPQSARVFDLLKTTGQQKSVSIVDPPRRKPDPVYLFLYPLPMTVLELISWMGGHTHFWSFDEDGRTRIPEEEWTQWGIPILAPYTASYTDLKSWPTHIYPALRNWQIARGFDPSTADWARECGYPEFEIIGAKVDQPQEAHEQPEKSRWSWSRLWTAIPGSDISAFAC
ncbi:hypothetical protein Moror_2342 [Moniliophthora roreri MCA 2997]|uniref:Uncharacterized protein n=1 Tax=Moniliophthora roreri (strain MCA 2997) TaxID=1381753 RepID=V2X0A3_MONRO|nr:hypothetical protein Moror_2342 [Moniliophthora roreri MCA 2997]